MKKISLLFLFMFSVTCMFSQIEGTWKLAPQAAAMGVGPTQGDIGWWSNSMGDVTTRACLFDDEFVFNADGSFMNVQQSETWLETWQGAAAEGCGTPVAPHDGSNAATWTYDSGAGTVMVSGLGAHLGLAKVTNAGELTDPANAPASVTYLANLSADGNTMTLEIDFGGGWWTFVLAKDLPPAALDLTGTWKLAPMAAAMGVGPTQGDIGWWSNTMADVTTRACLFDDQFIFNADGSFMNVQDGDTWLETWQGAAAEGCGAPVAPHDGSNAATWTSDATSVTLMGLGAHLGLAKVTNTGEITDPANAATAITYLVSLSADGNTMTVEVDFGGGWWTYVFEKEATVAPPLDVTGTWKLAPMAAAMGVGPTQGDIGWWSNTMADVTTRACLFDDKFIFNADGSFENVQDGSTWLEPWQGAAAEECGTPVAPHDGSNAATWTSDATSVTLMGLGAHLGLAKVTNTGELTDPANAATSITYLAGLSADGNTMTVEVDFGGGWWTYVFERETVVAPPLAVEGTWIMSPQAGAMAVGPTQGDYSWWSNSLDDVTTRACFFDDKFIFNADGSFENVQDGSTWLEPWQGVAAEECGTPVAPHDGSNAATYSSDATAGTVTLMGLGAHLGLPKVTNTGEINDPANAATEITYLASLSADGNTMTVEIDFGGGWWQFILVKEGVVIPSYDVTFKVDMNQYAGTQTAPYTVNLNGEFNGWCGGCDEMLDPDGDMVYEITKTLNEGDYRFKFTVNGWADQEEFAGGEACTNTNGDGFTDRVFTLAGADLDMDVVCYNSCEACAVSTTGLIDFNVFEVQPNPASDKVNINVEFAETTDATIRLLDITGRTIQSIAVISTRTELDVAELPTGVYFVVLSTNTGTATEKLMIQK